MTTARSIGFTTIALCALTVLGLGAVLYPTGMACVPLYCSADGFQFGIRFFVAALALAAVGRAALSMTNAVGVPPPGDGLFSSMAAGLVVLVTYVFARSLFNHLVWDLPVGRGELLLLVAAAGAYLVRVRKTASGRWSLSNLWLDLTLLLCLCIVVADRELPRQIMLSSDPDMHLFFGTQVERFGAVPFHQRDWGPEGFNYPAGSGVVLFVWRMLSGVDLRHVLVVLPVLFMFVATLMVAEWGGAGLEGRLRKLLLRVAAVAATAAGFMFPLFMQYAHLEGAARLMSVVPAALFMVFVIGMAGREGLPAGRWMLLPAMAIFVLGTLNPANVVIPALLLGALLVRAQVMRRPAWPMPVILLAGLSLLLLMAPYYQGLLGIVERARVDTVIYSEQLVIKHLSQIVDAAVQAWTSGGATQLRDATVLFAERGRPVFLSLGVGLLVALLLVRGRGAMPSAGGWWALIVFSVGLYLTYGFARALLDDRRFFLLGPYMFFSMTQYKALLLVLLMTLVLERLARVPWVGLALASGAAGVVVFVTMYLVRVEHAMYLAPRQTYCGVYGCLDDSDVRLLETFESQVQEGRFTEPDGGLPKVLVPNAFKNTEHESWILPVGSARVLPLFEVLPAAFYYYQGDLEYSTASYKARICDRLDRAWLRERRIRYLYLPSQRQDACVFGMNTLIQTEEVVLQEDGAYLLKLR